MTLRSRLRSGRVATVVPWSGLVLLPVMVPGYSSIRQTVSEIGQVGSPARIPFAAMLFFTWFVWLAGTSLMLAANRGLGDAGKRTTQLASD